MTYHNQSDSTITFNDGKDYTVYYSQIRNIQVKRGQKSNFSNGAILGTMTGAVIGFAPGSGNDYFGSNLAEISTAIASGLRFVSGSLVGLIRKTDNWKEVPIDDLKIGVTSNGGGCRIGTDLVF